MKKFALLLLMMAALSALVSQSLVASPLCLESQVCDNDQYISIPGFAAGQGANIAHAQREAYADMLNQVAILVASTGCVPDTIEIIDEGPTSDDTYFIHFEVTFIVTPTDPTGPMEP